MNTNEQLRNAYVRLVELSSGGNVELWNRIEVPAKRMQDAGWDDIPDGSYATVYSSTFSNDNETQFMNFTPIMNDGEVLTPDEFSYYCFRVVNDEISDSLKLKIGRTYSSLQDAIDAAIESHEVSEVFYDLRDEPKDSTSALEFKLLKERVKKECARRKYNGSVALYAGSSYNYTVQPTENSVPLPEHFNKIIVPMNAIADTGRTDTRKGYLVREIYTLSQQMTSLESAGIADAVSGCRSTCTGLCQGTCTETCSGNCGSGCYINCSSACGNYCQYSCSSNCGGLCKGSCTGQVLSNPS